MFDSLKSRNFMVVAVAEESRGAEHARPWIEQANTEYWNLIDTEHRVADLFGMVNVPQAVWIDEAGRIVRGPETAGATDHFRHRDRTTLKMTEADEAARQAARRDYFDAVKDWVETGRYALPAETVQDRLPRITPEIASANAHFRLGLWLHHNGRVEEATVHLAEASRLHPDSWTIWRQTADLDAVGKASSEAFWQRLDALGDRPFYPPPDLSGSAD